MIKRVIGAFVLGIIGTVFIAQFDTWTHKKIIKTCQQIARQSLGCHVSFTIQSLNFFLPAFIFTDIEVCSLQEGEWSWKCKKCTVNASWVQLLLHGLMERYVVIEGLDCSSEIKDGFLAIDEHITALMRESLVPFPIPLKSILFKNARISLHQKTSPVMSVYFNSSSFAIGERMQTALSFYDGQFGYQDCIYGQSMLADVVCSTWFESEKMLYSLSGSGVFTLPHLKEEGLCYISGSVESGHGRCSIRNAYNSLVIDPIVVTAKEIRFNGIMPLMYALACFQKKNIEQDVLGSVQCSVHITKDEPYSIKGQVVIEDAVIGQYHLCDVTKIIFSRKGTLWSSKLTMMRYHQECSGSGVWNEELSQGFCAIRNSTPLSLRVGSYWQVMPSRFVCNIWCKDYDLVAMYKLHVENRLSKKHHSFQGGFSYQDGALFLAGLLDNTELEMEANIVPALSLRHCSYRNSDKSSLLRLEQKDDVANNIQGHISFAFIRGFIRTFFQYDVQGEGMFSITGHASNSMILADIDLTDATIRLPETYNFIDGFHAHCEYDTTKNIGLCQDVTLNLYTGMISCLSATVHCDSKGNILFAHAPLILNRCLLNVKKDLFAIVSGNLLFSKQVNQTPLVKGSVIIDRAQLKENIFSSVIQKQLFDYPHSAFSLSDVSVACDLTIATKSPIKVDTPFLQTNAHVDVRVRKDKADPAVSGTITLHSGNLMFPYKPLFISKGILTFFPEQLFDPTIELFARNKIKKYDVSLQVAGSLQNHHIMLDSTPPLSEEQIMTLLLVGSEESLLNSMIPALILQNLKNLIFTNNQSSFFEKYFAPLLRPFNISLMPSFSDQTGRGGLRGMLEISIDDRWRAVIQKNFSLTEDTRFELDFLLSDDITLRGIRDERRDIGGEIEMRWKF